MKVSKRVNFSSDLDSPALALLPRLPRHKDVPTRARGRGWPSEVLELATCPLIALPQRVRRSFDRLTFATRTLSDALVVPVACRD